MELDRSYRGSTSIQASEYKKKGHKDEDIFAELINGEVIKGTGKADIKDIKNNTYSVKGGAKKWQIFLYGRNRFVDDKGFHFSNIGNFFLDSLNSFPNDYDVYKSHKELAKKKLLDFYRLNQTKPKSIKEYLDLIGPSNEYLNSKISLMKSNKNLMEALSDKENLKKFLSKSIFDNEKVDFWAIKEKDYYLVFEKNDAISVLSSFLKVDLSKQTTGRPDDITLAGQKVLLKAKTNVVEIEVRNDSKSHYRQIRFNMIREKTINLLKENFFETKVLANKIKFYKRSL